MPFHITFDYLFRCTAEFPSGSFGYNSGVFQTLQPGGSQKLEIIIRERSHAIERMAGRGDGYFVTVEFRLGVGDRICRSQSK